MANVEGEWHNKRRADGDETDAKLPSATAVGSSPACTEHGGKEGREGGRKGGRERGREGGSAGERINYQPTFMFPTRVMTFLVLH